MKKTLQAIALFTIIRKINFDNNAHRRNFTGSQDISNQKFEKNLNDARNIQKRNNRSTHVVESRKEPVVGSPDWAKRKNL